MRTTSVENTNSGGQPFPDCLNSVPAETAQFNNGSSQSKSRGVSDLLDRLLPLEGASHADVVAYTVEIPMRYAKCFAVLADGSKVALRNCRLFVGWSGWRNKRSFLFRTHGLQIEIQTDSEHPTFRNAPGNVFQVIAEAYFDSSAAARESKSANQPNIQRKFIAIDGSQIILAGPR